MDLSKEEIFRMINEYRNQRVLWDAEHKGYFNKDTKKKAWALVGEAVGVNYEDAKRKMSSLLGSFRRERARGKKLKAGDPHRTYISDWFAFKHFSFLLDSDEQENLYPEMTLEEQTSTSNDEAFHIEQIIVPKVETVTEDNEEEIHPEVTVDYSFDSTSEAFAKPSEPSRKRSRSFAGSEDSQNKSGYDSVELSSIANERREATAKFSRYLEAKLNQYNPTTNAILIHKINQLLFEADMNMISKSSHSMVTASPRSCITPSPPPLHYPNGQRRYP